MATLKTILLIFFILTILSSNYCHSITKTKELSPIFAFFIEFQTCASCNYLTINLNINLIEKKFPESKILVFVNIADSSMIDEKISTKIKSKHIYFLTPDDTDSLEKSLSVSDYPTLIVFNFNGDELLRYSGKEFESISNVKIIKTYDMNIIERTKKINYPIGAPRAQSLTILDSIVYYVDIVKNEIGEFNLQTGDSIKSIQPDDFLKDYSLSKLNKIDEQWINEKMYPLTNYKCIIPLSLDKILCLTTNVAGVTTDTSFVPKNNTVETNVCKLIKILSVLANIENGSTIKIDKFLNDDYTLAHLKRFKNGKLGASLSLMDKKKYLGNLKLLDSAYIFIQASKNDYSDAEYLLSYSVLMKAYGLDSINLYSLGLMDYCPQKDSYFYLNPFMNAFISYKKSNNQITKIVPKGLLCNIFDSNGKLAKFYKNDIQSKYVYYLMEWFIDEDKINILILPKNKEKFTDFFVISTYNLEGIFIKETYYYYDNLDHIFRVHLFGNSTNNKCYQLIQSKERKWQLFEK